MFAPIVCEDNDEPDFSKIGFSAQESISKAKRQDVIRKGLNIDKRAPQQ